MGGEFLEGEFFWGPLLLENTESKIRPKNSSPNFGSPKFVSQNSALNSGSGGAKLGLSKKYGSTPPICTAVPCQYAPHLYRRTFLASKLQRKGNPCNTPPISTAVRLPFVRQYVRPPFVRQYFWKYTGGRALLFLRSDLAL